MVNILLLTGAVWLILDNIYGERHLFNVVKNAIYPLEPIEHWELPTPVAVEDFTKNFGFIMFFLVLVAVGERFLGKQTQVILLVLLLSVVVLNVEKVKTVLRRLRAHV